MKWSIAVTSFLMIALLVLSGCAEEEEGGDGDGGGGGGPTSTLLITTASLPDGSVGATYSVTLNATGGTAAGYSWTISSGALPGGLALNGATISGVATAGGTFNFEVQVTDSGSNTNTASFSIQVAASPLVIVQTQSYGIVGQSSTWEFTAYGGTGAGHVWNLTGSLQPWATSGSSGNVFTISGTPTNTNAASITIDVSDSGGNGATLSLFLRPDNPVQIGITALPPAVDGQLYNVALPAVSGTGSGHVWSITAGSLPGGLQLVQGSPAAQITGMASGVSTNPITIQVEDSSTLTASQAFTLEVTPAISITTTSLPSAMSGVAYNQIISSSGGTGALTWSLAGGAMPSTWALNNGTPDATITGSTTEAGEYEFWIKVTDSVGVSDTRKFSLDVDPGAGNFTITTTSLPNATVGSAYNQTVQTTGTTGNVNSCTRVAGVFPSDLAISATGDITGTPTHTGSWRFLLRCGTDLGEQHQVWLTLTVDPPSSILTITQDSLPGAKEGDAYTAYVSASGGTRSGYTWTVLSGALPTGLGFVDGTPVATLTGTPSQSGSFNITLQVEDSGANTATVDIDLEVEAAGAPLAMLTATLPDAQVDNPYAESIIAGGGSGSGYLFTLVSGSLPPGLLLSNGALSGRPTQSGSFNFTVQVRDSVGATAQGVYSILVAAAATPLRIETELLPNLERDTAYSATVTASGGSGSGYTWSIIGGDAPFGVDITSGTPDATLAGTPTVRGAYRFALQVRDSDGLMAVRVYTVRVFETAQLEILAPKFNPVGVDGAPWSITVYASGGTGTGYDWSNTTVPSGFTLMDNGSSATVSGTPTTAQGTVTIDFDLRDSSANMATLSQNVSPITPGTTPTFETGIAFPRAPGGRLGKAYKLPFRAYVGDSTAFTFKLVSGALPPGLVINGDGHMGAVEGVPLVAGDYSFTLSAEDAGGSGAFLDFQILVSAGVTFFSKPAGNSISFVLDRSGSMGGIRHRTLRAELENAVLAADYTHEFDIVTFESAVDNMWGALRQATPENRAEALEFIYGGGIDPAGGTAMYPALNLALDTYPTTLESLFLAADGSPNIGGSASQTLADFPGWFAPFGVCEMHNTNIGGTASAENFLIQLAGLVGGTYTRR